MSDLMYIILISIVMVLIILVPLVAFVMYKITKFLDNAFRGCEHYGFIRNIKWK